ncbi:MAG: hypothetical protein ACRDSL_14985 [Pseudonocardiaceae bacterium]
MILQLCAVVAALTVGVLLTLYVELRARADHKRRQTHDCEPIFRMLRNGRVRFHLEDLRRSDRPTPGERYPKDHTVHPDLGHPDLGHPDLGCTIPDVLRHRNLPQHGRRPN